MTLYFSLVSLLRWMTAGARDTRVYSPPAFTAQLPILVHSAIAHA